MISPFFKKKDAVEKPNEQPQVLPQEAEHQHEEPVVETANRDNPYSAPLLNKSNLDKKSLDLLFAVEQMIQAKQYSELQASELQDRLHHSSGNIDRLNRDVKHLSQVIEEREKSVMELEQRIVDKNMKVDQVVEDYRELQRKLTAEIEELKSVISLEQQKYENLLHKHNDTLAEKNKRIHELEEHISRQEVEKHHLKQKFEATHQEKVYLANMISDFTNRMSLPLGKEG